MVHNLSVHSDQQSRWSRHFILLNLENHQHTGPGHFHWWHSTWPCESPLEPWTPPPSPPQCMTRKKTANVEPLERRRSLKILIQGYRPAYPKRLLLVLQTARVHIFRFLPRYFEDAPPPVYQNKNVKGHFFSHSSCKKSEWTHIFNYTDALQNWHTMTGNETGDRLAKTCNQALQTQNPVTYTETKPLLTVQRRLEKKAMVVTMHTLTQFGDKSKPNRPLFSTCTQSTVVWMPIWRGLAFQTPPGVSEDKVTKP